MYARTKDSELSSCVKFCSSSRDCEEVNLRYAFETSCAPGYIESIFKSVLTWGRVCKEGELVVLLSCDNMQVTNLEQPQ